MRYLFEEYGDMAISLAVSITIIILFISVSLTDIYHISAQGINADIEEKVINNSSGIVGIKSFVVKDGFCYKGDVFNWDDRIIAINTNGENINSFVKTLNDVDTSSAGEQEVTYILRYNGQSMIGKAKLIVEEREELNEEYD